MTAVSKLFVTPDCLSSESSYKSHKVLYLGGTQVVDAGCAALAAALDSGALPALEELYLRGIPASAAAMVSVRQAQARSDFCESRRVSLEGVVERGGRSRVWTSSD